VALEHEYNYQTPLDVKKIALDVKEGVRFADPSLVVEGLPKGTFNTFRLGNKWVSAVNVGDVVALTGVEETSLGTVRMLNLVTDESFSEDFSELKDVNLGYAVVSAVYFGPAAEMLADHTDDNHVSSLDAFEGENEAAILEAMRAGYGDESVSVAANYTVLYLTRII